MECFPLTRDERQIAKEEAPPGGAGGRLVDALTVMPDHAHILATPLPESLDRHYALATILGRGPRGVRRPGSTIAEAGQGRSGRRELQPNGP